MRCARGYKELYDLLKKDSMNKALKALNPKSPPAGVSETGPAPQMSDPSDISEEDNSRAPRIDPKDERIKELEDENARLRDELAKETERAELNSTESTNEVEARFEKYVEQYNVAKGQIAEWQNNYEEQRRIAAGLRKKVKQLEGIIEGYEGG